MGLGMSGFHSNNITKTRHRHRRKACAILSARFFHRDNRRQETQRCAENYQHVSAHTSEQSCQDPGTHLLGDVVLAMPAGHRRWRTASLTMLTDFGGRGVFRAALWCKVQGTSALLATTPTAKHLQQLDRPRAPRRLPIPSDGSSLRIWAGVQGTESEVHAQSLYLPLATKFLPVWFTERKKSCTRRRSASNCIGK